MSKRWESLLFLGLTLAVSSKVWGAEIGSDTTSKVFFSRQGSLRKAVRSWKSLQESKVVMQDLDYSCGAAALATILRYYFQDDVGEKIILDKILLSLSPSEKKDREENGFSLYDLKEFTTARGYEAVGFRLSFAGLAKIKTPVLIHLMIDGEKHFAVLKGIRGDRVYLADPIRGNLRMKVEDFAREWTRVALVVSKPGREGSNKNDLAPLDEERVLDHMLSAYRSTVRSRR